MNNINAQGQDINLLKDTFRNFGNLDLLGNYRGQSKLSRSVVTQSIQFAIICLAWVSIILGASLAAAFSLVVAIPFSLDLVLKYVFAPLNLPYAVVLELISFIKSLSPLVVVMTFIPVNAMFLVLLERKLLSLLTRRLGPNRVGYNGFLQTFADGLKLLFKEDILPTQSDKVLFFIAPALFFIPSILVFLPIISVASGAVGAFSGTSFEGDLIFVFAMASLSILGLVLAGYASNNKYSLLGGLRSVAQAISYEIPLILVVICFIILTGSMNLLEINNQQGQGLLSWNIFAGGEILNLGQYIQWISKGEIFSGIMAIVSVCVQIALFPVLGLLLYSCFLAETNRIPFDLPEAESELVSGFNTEFSGMKFALFFLAEYTNLFVASALFSILFLGGTNSMLPFVSDKVEGLLRYTIIGDLSWLLGAIILLIKSYLLISVAIWIRATLPRFRSDQLMSLAWKVLIPLTLVLVVISAACKIYT